MKSTPGGFPNNSQEDRRNPPMKPRRGPAGYPSPRKQGAPGGSGRINTAKDRATGCWQHGEPRKRPATVGGSRFHAPGSPATFGVARFSTRTWPAPCGMAFASPSSKETQAPKRPATRCRSLWTSGHAVRSVDSLWPIPRPCADRTIRRRRRGAVSWGLGDGLSTAPGRR